MVKQHIKFAQEEQEEEQEEEEGSSEEGNEEEYDENSEESQEEQHNDNNATGRLKEEMAEIPFHHIVQMRKNGQSPIQKAKIRQEIEKIKQKKPEKTPTGA
jgi:hypothetical protein